MQEKDSQNTENTLKTKVLFVITKGVWGGAAQYVYTLATSLPTADFESIVLCGDGEALPEKLREKNIRVEVLSSLKRDVSFLQEIKSFFSLLSFIKKEKPDVLHLNSAKASGLGALAGRIAGVRRIIYTAHGFAFNEDRGNASKLLIWIFSWLTILLSHKTIVIAEREERQAVEMFCVSEKKIVLIRNGIDTILFKEKDTAQKELTEMVQKNNDVNVPHDAFWIGTLAELHKNKGLEYAIRALAKVTKAFVFYILGTGEEKENLQKLIVEQHLEDTVFLVGFVENARQYLSAFDIFLFTSVKEGLPYAILEAGQAGLPVVASSVGGIPDIVDNAKNGILVTAKKTGEITRAIEYLIANQDIAHQFGTGLKEKVQKEFSVEKMIAETSAIYNK